MPKPSNVHAPYPQYATIHALQLCSEPEAGSYWPFELSTPGPVLVDGDTEQLFRLGGHPIHALHVYLCICKRISTL